MNKFTTEFDAPNYNIALELNYEQPATDELIAYARNIIEEISNGKA